jgi:hypothetical protein
MSGEDSDWSFSAKLTFSPTQKFSVSLLMFVHPGVTGVDLNMKRSDWLTKAC